MDRFCPACGKKVNQEEKGFHSHLFLTSFGEGAGSFPPHIGEIFFCCSNHFKEWTQLFFKPTRIGE